MNKDFWERIDRLEELAKAATKGPWKRDALGTIFREPQTKEECYPIVLLTKNYDNYVPTEENASYIAAASPDIVLEMIAEIRQLAADTIPMKHDLFATRYQAEKQARNNLELREKLNQLEKEADWLAGRCREFCLARPRCENILTVQEWRETAREDIRRWGK